MAVPWTGFPMSALIREVDPLPSAKYMRMVTAYRPKEMPGIGSQPHYDWPYQEAMTIKEAMNELALFGTGIYGKPLPKQNGAPFRAIIPWKYGLKSIKSIVEIEFTKKRPPTLWNKAAPTEYGWYFQRKPAQAASALVAGGGADHSVRAATPNSDVQRLRGIRRRVVHRQGVLSAIPRTSVGIWEASIGQQ